MLPLWESVRLLLSLSHSSSGLWERWPRNDVRSPSNKSNLSRLSMLSGQMCMAYCLHLPWSGGVSALQPFLTFNATRPFGDPLHLRLPNSTRSALQTGRNRPPIPDNDYDVTTVHTVQHSVPSSFNSAEPTQDERYARKHNHVTHRCSTYPNDS